MNLVTDLLEKALQGFPDAKEIVRCTRCIQLRFAFMHMDVAVLDPSEEPRNERTGDIFHSPDKGADERVPSNPYGFAYWVRTNVIGTIPLQDAEKFTERLKERRTLAGIDRLIQDPRAAEQDELPPSVPPRIDAQQIVALKLMKRFLNLKYEDRGIKKPPSIYMTKTIVDCGYEPNGLTSQLKRQAGYIEAEMDKAISVNGGPDERNPTYPPDRINDRWPSTPMDRITLRDDMKALSGALAVAQKSSVSDIAAILGSLFGEQVTTRSVKRMIKQSDEAGGKTGIKYERGTGAILAASTLTAPVVAKKTSPLRDHTFHPGRINAKPKRNR